MRTRLCVRGSGGTVTGFQSPVRTSADQPTPVKRQRIHAPQIKRPRTATPSPTHIKEFLSYGSLRQISVVLLVPLTSLKRGFFEKGDRSWENIGRDAGV